MSTSASNLVSRRSAIAGFGAAGAGLALATRAVPARAAQEARASHPLVGAWSDVDPATPENLAYNIFHADGTVVIQSPFGGIGIGVWRPTGDDTAESTVYFGDIEPDPTRYVQGRATGSSRFTVDTAGASYTAEFTITLQTPDGKVIFTMRGTLAGTRLEFAPMESLATPVASANVAPAVE